MTWTPAAQGRVSLPQDLELLQLGPIIGVGQTTGTQAVAQAQGDVVCASDVQKPGIMFVQGIFPREKTIQVTKKAPPRLTTP